MMMSPKFGLSSMPLDAGFSLVDRGVSVDGDTLWALRVCAHNGGHREQASFALRRHGLAEAVRRACAWRAARIPFGPTAEELEDSVWQYFYLSGRLPELNGVDLRNPRIKSAAVAYRSRIDLRDVRILHRVFPKAVAPLVEAMAAGEVNKFPPVLVAQYEDFFLLLDGHHRIAAAKELGVPTFQAWVVPFGEMIRVLQEQFGGRSADVIGAQWMDEFIIVEGQPYAQRA